MSKDVPPIIEFPRKIRKIGDSIVITIPKEITVALGINEGDTWKIYAKDGKTIVITKE
ncbi:MAG: AbrB/MazE/SpoVT family DNA-binding domain-containing protein [Candidatus Heimdallarchaeota archaeon]|nr:AbrB/MazE/SpoVT family DNA-binding domain-containing protein [Candidatus Heimdallarchaeota archaeon]